MNSSARLMTLRSARVERMASVTLRALFRPLCLQGCARLRVFGNLTAWSLTAFVVAVLSACQRSDTKRPEPSPVCALKVPARVAQLQTDALPPEVWFELLFKGYRDGVDGDPVDCSGEPIAWTELPQRCSEHEPSGDDGSRLDALPAEASPARPGERFDRVIVRHASADYWFAWAPFRQLDNGMREGPIAIARLYDGTLEARAVGTLRAFADKVRLDIRQLGPEHMLVAEGEWCAPSAPCVRGTRLMWLDRQRFRARPVRSAAVRSCLGPAWFVHAEKLEKKLGRHWSRTLERAAVLTYQPNHISLQERIVVNDRDLERPGLPPRLFRDAQAQLTLTLRDGELLSEGQSLWPAIKLDDSPSEPASPRSP